MRAILHASTLCLLLATAACAGSSGSGDPTPARSMVRIENRSSFDMDIYVRPAVARPIRLGFVPASETVEFTLARSMLAGSASFHLEARPIRAGGGAVVSEPFTSGAGEELFWSIPPQ